MTFKIRNANIDDAAQVSALFHLAQGKASIPVHGIGDIDWAIRFYEWMFRQCGTFWSYDTTKVAVADDRIVGLISFYPNDKDRAYRRTRNDEAVMAFYSSQPLDRLKEYAVRYDRYGDGTPAMTVARSIYVMNVAVVSDKRRCGVARALLGVADRACVEHSYQSCSLHVEDGNQDAINLFERCGYSVLARGSGAGCRTLCDFAGYHYMAKPSC